MKSLLFMGLMSLCRLLFWIFNYNFFSSVGFSEFLQGMRFDAVAGAYGLLPAFLLMAAGFPLLTKKKVQVLVRNYVLVILAIYSMLNFIDTIYFRFTLKRSTWDIFDFVSTGDDTISLIPQFLLDFWYMLALWIAFVLLARYLNRKTEQNISKEPIFRNVFYSLIMILTVVVSARGGIQLKPLNIIDASRYVQGQNVSLVLNTPFTILKTYDSDHLKEVNYFPESELGNYFDPHLVIPADSQAQMKNIVVFVMESFSREYIGFYNDGKGYSPFLDSLMAHSLVFENAFANGKRSIEALPAIFSGLPNLMNEAFKTSPYAGNKIPSLAVELKKLSYGSHFYHGGKNGTMGFDSYTRHAGFDAYYGLDEYPVAEDFDGSWGIYDIPYFNYVARQLDKTPPPFLAGVFSLSAHHPYRLPKDYQVSCPKGDLPIHNTVCYSDDALRHFFSMAGKMSWYKNTVFVITADHTAQSTNKKYQSSKGIYAIPLVIYDPSSSEGLVIDKTVQQADIPATIMDYLGLEVNMFSFGQSGLDTSSSGMAVNYLNGLYQLIEDDHTILFDGNKITAAYRNDPDGSVQAYKEMNPELEKSEDRLKAIIQTYNNGMIKNKLREHEH